jgi:ATP-binding cassette subfamily B protein
VVDHGRIVQRGPHADLVRQDGSVYAGLHRSWISQHGRPSSRPA